MAVPEFKLFMKPMLDWASTRGECTMSEAQAYLQRHLKLSDSDVAELVPSGRQTRFDNRASWARTYLSKAKLLRRTGHGRFEITDEGRDVAARGPAVIDKKFLRNIPTFRQFSDAPAATPVSPDPVTVALFETESDGITPEEDLERSFQRLREALSEELLERVRSATPAFFERLVVSLLVSMGYGGSRRDAGAAVGASNDGGIDGIIKEDRLGLDAIYVQAKRWSDNAVIPRDLREFVGALEGRGAKKGVFITTSTFSLEATKYADALRDKRVVLIDGSRLTDLMIDFDVGVAKAAKYVVKRVDSDFFGEG